MMITKLLLILSVLSLNLFANPFASLKDYKGKTISVENAKIILVVNIATRCGYTGQLDGLQKLYSKFKSKGLILIGVPSNEFGSQSPESNEEIAKFCRMNFGVNFPIMKRASVLSKTKNGDKPSSLIRGLVKQSGEGEILWNFEKFLVSKDGKLLKRFRSSTTPESDDLQKEIKKSLKTGP